MKKALDNFSKQANVYKKFRPTYPLELYKQLLAHVPETGACWDCGTGNGQVAVVLFDYFDKVFATDLSEAQISRAMKGSNITYAVERAEKTHFQGNTFDLITVAQAAHWFDFDAFNKEVKRVAKNNAIVGMWGYGLLRIEPVIDELIDQFYVNVVGPYWDSERKYIDAAYETIPFPFDLIEASEQQSMGVSWTEQHLEGFLNSWSAVQHYRNKNQNKNPVPELMKALSKVWDDCAEKEIRFPIFMKMGKVFK